MSNHNEKKRIRKILIKARKALSPEAQQNHAEKILFALKSFAPFTTSLHTGLYNATGGEVLTDGIARHLWENNRHCYLPVMSPDGKKLLYFAPWHENSIMEKKNHGVYEPQHNPDQLIPASRLDMVLIPLAGFDRHRVRLGMGGGYYDCTFQNMNQWENRPCLAGIAHELQYVRESLPRDPWDVPLDAVFTETRIRCNE